MNIIIFSAKAEGHFLEYTHHLYNAAINDKKNNYYFILPDSFSDLKKRWSWPDASNVYFDLFSKKTLNGQTPSLFSQIKYSFALYKKLKGDIKKYNVHSLLFLSLVDCVMTALFFYKEEIAINGILYRLYTREETKNVGFYLDVFKCFIVGKLRVFKNVFILNDGVSARYLNIKYKTKKFKYLSDPYVPINGSKIDFRKENSISKSSIVFAHIGSLSYNKGTIEVLKSLKYISLENKYNYTFVFAGKIIEETRSEFYSILDEVKDKCKVIVFDRFCSYDFLADICIACNALVIPYRRTAQSSGIIGYASQFGKPVISINKGLLGSLIRKYSLGILINNSNVSSLLEAYKKIEIESIKAPSYDYCNNHTIEMFQVAILSNIV